MATEPQRSETMSGASSSSELAAGVTARSDVSADAALILAALGRMEAVVRDERAAFDRLRVLIGDMAQAITRAKTVADSETAATLLDELEHRVDAMIEIAGGQRAVPASAAVPEPPPPTARAEYGDVVEPTAEHSTARDQVPTVSDVVSRLGTDDQALPAAANIPPPADDGAISAPTVAMLTAMVEALRDSISTAAPPPETAVEAPQLPPETMGIIALPLDWTTQLEVSPIEIADVGAPEAETGQAVEATQTAEAMHTAEAAAIPRSNASDLHETALLASLEQMGARPFPPPDEGTAVIFKPKPESEFLEDFAPERPAPAETAAEPEHVAVSQFATEPVAIEQALPEQTAAEGQHEPLHAIEPVPALAETTMAEIIADLTQAPAPAPPAYAAAEVAAADVEPTLQIEPTAETAAAGAPSDTMAVSAAAESDFDPTDFLFGPEPELDPAAFLLDPAPQPPAPQAKTVDLPQPEFVATPSEPAAEVPEASQPVEPDRPTQTALEPAPRDPLRALKAMSENEKLALFS